MFFEPVTESEWLNEITNLRENKSAGHNEINAEILKPLAYIYNLTFLTGKIPKSLKIALVTPIFKANDSNLFENYRPISVWLVFEEIDLSSMPFYRVY
jgi:hypothetical protein